jgi:murein DD-endopeptidase MepM/ murein hydrolase activator NlpD
MSKGKTLLASLLAGILLVLGLQAPARASVAQSDTRLAVANTATVPAVATIITAKATLNVTVIPGNTLSGLAEQYCGDWHWQQLYDDNKAVVGADPNLIYPGQQLVVNCTSASSAPAPAPVAPTPVAPAVSNTGWFNPLPGHVSYCNFWEWRKTPTGGYNHRGEDISANYGTPIHAVHAGNVSTQWDNGGGNMTIITHDGMAEVYMHQSSYAVRSGHVNGGDVIGYVGQTGDATGPHLHLEIQPWGAWNGVTSPDKWLADRGVYIGC